MGKWGNQGEGATKLEAPMPTFRWEEAQPAHPTGGWSSIARSTTSPNGPAGTRGASGSSGTTPGEDATDAFLAFHRNLGFVPKFMKPLLIGELAPEEPGPRQEFPDHRGLPGPKEDR